MIEIKRDNELLCRAKVAHNLFSRALGLMLKKTLPHNEGLLIEYSRYLSSRGVHGFFMRFPIDLAFINQEKHVVEIANLQPWRIYNPTKDCQWVLELNEGFLNEKDIRIGDVLDFEG
jgi:uncharacterized membrane protein (UPF0127 family)